MKKNKIVASVVSLVALAASIASCTDPRSKETIYDFDAMLDALAERNATVKVEADGEDFIETYYYGDKGYFNQYLGSYSYEYESYGYVAYDEGVYELNQAGNSYEVGMPVSANPDALYLLESDPFFLLGESEDWLDLGNNMYFSDDEDLGIEWGMFAGFGYYAYFYPVTETITVSDDSLTVKVVLDANEDGEEDPELIISSDVIFTKIGETEMGSRIKAAYEGFTPTAVTWDEEVKAAWTEYAGEVLPEVTASAVSGMGYTASGVGFVDYHPTETVASYGDKLVAAGWEELFDRDICGTWAGNAFSGVTITVEYDEDFNLVGAYNGKPISLTETEENTYAVSGTYYDEMTFVYDEEEDALTVTYFDSEVMDSFTDTFDRTADVPYPEGYEYRAFEKQDINSDTGKVETIYTVEVEFYTGAYYAEETWDPYGEDLYPYGVFSVSASKQEVLDLEGVNARIAEISFSDGSKVEALNFTEEVNYRFDDVSDSYIDNGWTFMYEIAGSFSSGEVALEQIKSYVEVCTAAGWEIEDDALESDDMYCKLTKTTGTGEYDYALLYIEYNYAGSFWINIGE